jgi:type VI secretion system protein ImpC
MLAASRFAHYVKVIARDKVGSFQTRDTLQSYLNTWIADYICLDGAAPQETKARLPLASARIDVTEVPGRPGSYTAVVFVRPHFQMEELTASIRMVAELPAPAA